MRKRFEMTQEQYEKILEASRPVPVMFGSGGVPLFSSSSQENANRAWQSLAKEMGFKWDSVRPTGEGDKVFTAEEETPNA